MKKASKWIVAGIILAMAVSVVSVCALDETQAASQSISATAVTYDVGSYGCRSTGYLVEWNTDVTFPTARYKRSTTRYAAHKADSVTPHNGGFAWWCVMCVSDGEQATDCVYFDAGGKQTSEYYDTYGTMGYTDQLRIQGCMGSMSAGATVYYAHWCPDSQGIS